MSKEIKDDPVLQIEQFSVWGMKNIWHLWTLTTTWTHVRDNLFQMLSAEDKAHTNDIYC